MFWIKLLFYLGSRGQGGVGGGSFGAPGPKIFLMEPGAQNLSLLGARTKMLILAKWSPGVR